MKNRNKIFIFIIVCIFSVLAVVPMTVGATNFTDRTPKNLLNSQGAKTTYAGAVLSDDTPFGFTLTSTTLTNYVRVHLLNIFLKAGTYYLNYEVTRLQGIIGGSTILYKTSTQANIKGGTGSFTITESGVYHLVFYLTTATTLTEITSIRWSNISIHEGSTPLQNFEPFITPQDYIINSIKDTIINFIGGIFNSIADFATWALDTHPIVTAFTLALLALALVMSLISLLFRRFTE